jgi:hypothetical protein
MANTEAYPDDSNKEAAVEMVRPLKDQSEDGHLAIRCCEWLKKGTHSDDGSGRR